MLYSGSERENIYVPSLLEYHFLRTFLKQEE